MVDVCSSFVSSVLCYCCLCTMYDIKLLYIVVGFDSMSAVALVHQLKKTHPTLLIFFSQQVADSISNKTPSFSPNNNDDNTSNKRDIRPLSTKNLADKNLAEMTVNNALDQVLERQDGVAVGDGHRLVDDLFVFLNCLVVHFVFFGIFLVAVCCSLCTLCFGENIGCCFHVTLKA